MFQDNLGLVIALVIFVVVVSVLLLFLVIFFKIQRDRRERRGRKFRDRVWQAWIDNNATEMVKTCRTVAKGDHQAQADFIQMCERAVGAEWWDDERLANLRRASDDAGLTGALRKQLNSRNDVKRGMAATIAGYPGVALRPHEIAPLMGDREPTVRLAAAGSLERMADPLAADALITALLDQLLPDERIIERLGHPWAVESILTVLNDPPPRVDSRVRCGLARALTLAADPRAIPAMEVMANDGELEERVQALKALVACAPNGSDRQRAELEVFARHLMDDEHPVIRTQVALILGAGRSEADVPILTHMVSDRDWFVRRAAAKSLAQLGRPGLAALRRIAQSDDEFAAQRAREELTFATIMAARRSAETGEDFDDLLGGSPAPSDGGGPSGAAIAGIVGGGLAGGVAGAAAVPTPAPEAPTPPAIDTPAESVDSTEPSGPRAAAVQPVKPAPPAQPVPPVQSLSVPRVGQPARLASSGPAFASAAGTTVAISAIAVPPSAIPPSAVPPPAGPPAEAPAPIVEAAAAPAATPAVVAAPAEPSDPALSIRLAPSAAPAAGECLVIAGRYRPADRNLRARADSARLQVRLGDRWRTLDKVRLTGKGRFAFLIDDVGGLGASYTYRVLISGVKKKDLLERSDPIAVTVAD